MGTDRLYQVLPIMRELKKERREEVEQFFQDAPDWLLDSFRVVELDKNVVFIRENQPVDTVHIIVRGCLKSQTTGYTALPMTLCSLTGSMPWAGWS